MMRELINAVCLEVERRMGTRASTRIATVTSYDPGKYAVKATIQPEGTETGWIPLKSPWIGNGWGLFAPPSIGDAIEVAFQEGGKDAGMAGSRLYSAESAPLPVPSGEFWIQHESGSLIKFHNDGSVELTAATNMTLTAAQTMRIVGKDVQIHGTSTYRFDANGQGQKFNGSNVETWQDNDTTGAHHNHQPPEIG